MSYVINLDFLLVKKIKILKVFNNKFINEKRIDCYEFFNILKVPARIFNEIFSKDSYDKIIDKF